MNTRLSNPRILRAGLIALGLVAGYGLAVLVSGDDAERRAQQGPPAAEAARAPAGEQQMYTCSMHPQVRSPNPDDKCPICGMDLIPVAAHDEHEQQGEVQGLQLSQRSAALINLEVRPAERRAVQVPVRLFGRLDPDETRLRVISAWVPGRLDRLYVDFTGVSVREGQPMVQLYSPKLIAAQEELLHALRASRELEAEGVGVVQKSSRETVVASRDRLRLLGLSPAQIEAVERRGRVDDHVTITAPVSGVVTERLAAEGDYVDTGQPIYRVVDLSQLWAQLEVYESDLAWLEVGQRALFSTQAYPGQPFEGTISFIDPILNDRTRTARVRVDIPNPDGRLKPGMFVRGVIDTSGQLARAEPSHDGHGGTANDPAAAPTDGDETEPLVIPASAPLITGRRAVVYVQVPDGGRLVFQPRDVRLGRKAGDWYIVEDGLEEGDLVVAHGAFKIDAELQIRGEPSMMQPEGGAAPVHAHGPEGGQKSEPAHDTHDTGDPEPAAGHFRSALGALVRAQFALVNALADDEAEAAGRAARAAGDALGAIDAGLIRDGKLRRDWQRLAGTMRRSLDELAAAAVLEAQRRHFAAFSGALTEAVRSFGVAGAGPIYRARCPMVPGDTGYWLQNEKVVANPYQGGAMRRCGSIVETLAEGEEHGGHES